MCEGACLCVARSNFNVHRHYIPSPVDFYCASIHRSLAARYNDVDHIWYIFTISRPIASDFLASLTLSVPRERSIILKPISLPLSVSVPEALSQRRASAHSRFFASAMHSRYEPIILFAPDSLGSLGKKSRWATRRRAFEEISSQLLRSVRS